MASEISEPYVILVGSPVDGITLHGMFSTADDAAEFALAVFKNDTWWIASVDPVEKEDS